MEKTMKKILFLIAFLTTAELSAEPYETAQRFAAGDVISAEVLNDILDRIELSLKDITVAELVGTWSATQHVCMNSLYRAPGIGIQDAENDNAAGDMGYGCLWGSTGNSNFPDHTGWDSVTTMEDGLYGKRTDTITITAVSGSDTAFTIQSENFNFIMRIGSTQGAGYKINSGATHKCAIIGNNGVFGCLLDEAIVTTSSQPLRRAWVYYNMRRLSPSRFEIVAGPVQAMGIVNLVILDKTDIAPEAPTALSASVAGNASAATVTLSWTINGSTATGGVVKRKTSIDGTWSTLGTPSTGSYSDTTITLNNTYWYRVFTTNANGTSIGSNVIKVYWANTPPTINIPSTISVNENQYTDYVFTTLSVTDAEAQPLTLTLGSQSPGNDASDFTLASSGGLSFNTTPDYENPADYDTNNIYDLKLTATDGIDTVSQDFSVVVLDVSESN
jgi:hypothetical protein